MNFGANFGANFGENFGNFVSNFETFFGNFVPQKGGANTVTVRQAVSDTPPLKTKGVNLHPLNLGGMGLQGLFWRRALTEPH